jgi:hypothetical protein
MRTAFIVSIAFSFLGGCSGSGTLENSSEVKGDSIASLVAVDGTPNQKGLERIAYMSRDAGPPNQFSRLDDAKGCNDLELAMRWNRPPTAASGQQLTYITSKVPKDLAKGANVFVSGRIIKSGSDPRSGVAVWVLRLRDGSSADIIMLPQFWRSLAQQSRDAGRKWFIAPETADRMFCGSGSFQGPGETISGSDTPVPVFGLVLAMDRKT